MRKFVYLVTLIFLLSIASPALALDRIHRGGAGNYVEGDPWQTWPAEISTAWDEPNNWVFWDPGNGWLPEYPTMPTGSQEVCLNRGSAYPVLIDSSTTAVAGALHVGFWPRGELDVTGGSLAVGGMLSVGTAGDRCNGYMDISGGTITVGGHFVVGGEDPWEDPCNLYGSGDGILTMSAGLVTVTGNLKVGTKAGSGHMELSGGTIIAADLDMTANGELHIGHTGLLVLPGTDLISKVQGYIDSSWIPGGSVAQLLTGPYAGSTGVTPEPATLTLLGIGGLALLRRKR